MDQFMKKEIWIDESRKKEKDKLEGKFWLDSGHSSNLDSRTKRFRKSTFILYPLAAAGTWSNAILSKEDWPVFVGFVRKSFLKAFLKIFEFMEYSKI